MKGGIFLGGRGASFLSGGGGVPNGRASVLMGGRRGVQKKCRMGGAPSMTPTMGNPVYVNGKENIRKHIWWLAVILKVIIKIQTTFVVQM